MEMIITHQKQSVREDRIVLVQKTSQKQSFEIFRVIHTVRFGL